MKLNGTLSPIEKKNFSLFGTLSNQLFYIINGNITFNETFSIVKQIPPV
jgi:hypothetical protein